MLIIKRELYDKTFQEIDLSNELIQIIKLNKSNLNKIISWSSSRYETQRKFEVINQIYNNMINNQILNDYFHSGSYCESGSCSQKGTYYIDYGKKLILDIIDNDNYKITKILNIYII